MLSFSDELEITTGTARDWAYFARWHYRSHRVGTVRFVTLLWHGERAIGVCVFGGPPLSLAGRNRFYGRSGKWTSLNMRALNKQLVMLSRVVLHPTYRGAGIATAFVRKSCEACPFPWIETLSQLGRINPFFEKAGFVRVDVPQRRSHGRAAHSALYGSPERRATGRIAKRLVTATTHAQSRYSDPVYYIFDNRANVSARTNPAN